MVYGDTKLIPNDCKLLESHLSYLLTLAGQDRPLYLVLDGVDHLSSTDGALGLSWLPLQLPLHVKVIVSTSSETQYRCYPVLKSLIVDDAYLVKVCPCLCTDYYWFFKGFTVRHTAQRCAVSYVVAKWPLFASAVTRACEMYCQTGQLRSFEVDSGRALSC